MSRQLRPVGIADADFTMESCITYLKAARMAARRLDTPRLLKRIDAALDSADGAQRHLRRRLAHNDTTV